jgi:hypothetical protein
MFHIQVDVLELKNIQQKKKKREISVKMKVKDGDSDTQWTERETNKTSALNKQ